MVEKMVEKRCDVDIVFTRMVKDYSDGTNALYYETYLEKFLSKTTFAEFFYSQDFCPTDVIELINDLRKPIAVNDFGKLFKILDLISDVESSNYSEKERVQTLRYFLNLKEK